MSPNNMRSRRRTPNGGPLNLDSRLTLGPGVTFEETTTGVSWTVITDGVPSSRVSPAVVALLSAMDGDSTVKELHSRFGGSESQDDFLTLLERFRRNGLTDCFARKKPSHFKFMPPLSLQIATLRAPALFTWMDRITRPIMRRPALVLISGIFVLGLVASAFQSVQIISLMVSPIPFFSLVALLLLLSFLTVLHESAHGLALTRYGGKPSRAGFMIFYLTPAFFVDVTDGWRLTDRWKRVVIALAGPAVHAVIGAVCAIIAIVAVEPAVHQMLLVLAVACYGIVVVNLIPFVRFDGYIAFMSALDEPNLRVRTMADGAAWLKHFLYGGLRPAKNFNRSWSVVFGLASLFAPVALVLFAVYRIVGLVPGGNIAFALLVIALEVSVCMIALVILYRALSRVLKSGISPWRFWCVNMSILLAFIVAGLTISVPNYATVGFAVEGKQVDLVQSLQGLESEIPDGAHVRLMSNGILASAVVGEGVARSRPPQPVEVPMETFFPVEFGGVMLSASIVGTVDVADSAWALPSFGQAQVDLGVVPLWKAIWDSAVIRPLGIERTD